MTSLARVGASELFGPEEQSGKLRTIGASELFGPEEISEAEANRTLTPEEQGMVARANQPQFGAGLSRRMDEYRGLSPQEASAKYRASWADTISNVYDTVTDPSKLASIAGGAIKAGANAVAHPIDTAQRIGNYYYENPDAAVTDVAFAAFPAKYGIKALEKAGDVPKSSAMPRASVRDEAELLSTGGKRIEDSKLNPSKVEAEALVTPMQEFREATKTTVIDNPKVKNIAARLESAYTPNKPDTMSRLTGTKPKDKPPITLTELHQHQQRLDDVIDGPGKNKDGRINSQGRAAIELKKAVGKMIDAHPESNSFKIGKHEYHRGKMSQALGDIMVDAQKRAQWKNGDEAGALSNAIGTYLGKKSNRYALTPEVRKKLDKLSRDKKGKLLGAFGSQNIGGFTFARAAETAFGAPGILAIPGHFARQGRNSRFIKEFEAIQEEIRAGGPVR